MRTSRISRDTSAGMSALSSSPRRRRLSAQLHQTARVSRYAATTDPSAPIKHDASTSDSDLSSVPSDFDEARGTEAKAADVAPTLQSSRKRKRGDAGANEDIGDPNAAGIAAAAQASRTRAGLEAHDGIVNPTAAAKKARRAPAKKTVAAGGAVAVEPPRSWEEMYNLTVEMRKKVVAPVDTMGCERLADETRPPRDQRLQTLISLMLSSQTKDTVTAAAIKNLQENLPGGFTLESLLKVEPELLNELILKVGFHNNKTKYIKQTAEILRDKFDGDIPDTIKGLISLPGVGPKMAYLCMSAAWGRDEGIGVDVHVHRITNLWGWHKTRQPEETRAALEAWLPREKWHQINHLLVGFGQTICLPLGRKCGECALADRGLCPGAVVGKSQKIKKENVTVKDEGSDGDVAEREVEDVIKVEDDVKAEDVPAKSIVDIEDIGLSRPRRSRRTGK
ncbi:uncharacterized protein K452DRAFT_288773 [Aplosporella prunicola CBS 121167]|uniref:Endonuclease III homolog n=1 Tax=Aplosporella prunicola CBS 121167 TaxID=1176127 RepID=A0A6A6B920_9PEZI|nr:uncharacterized protein K452DRAFT_288773 [Aplosporella prunicola CBS 121167]KAF2140679.1 hypothetical protein K452DRAFT_288773 [Aplosporella prunicola CBS 121167]